MDRFKLLRAKPDYRLAPSLIHLRSLEAQLGVTLLNHARRPMILTPVGAVFFKNIDEALKLIRMAQTEVTLGNMTEARHLKFGLIEDFDSDIGPELAVLLANGMPKCDFAHYTRSSSEILDMLQGHSLDIGIASSPNNNTDQLQELPDASRSLCIGSACKLQQSAQKVFWQDRRS